MTIDDFEAPYIQQLRHICSQIGYGHVMQLASEMWGELTEAEGIGQAQHTVAPARSLFEAHGFKNALELLNAWEAVSVHEKKRVKKVLKK